MKTRLICAFLLVFLCNSLPFYGQNYAFDLRSFERVPGIKSSAIESILEDSDGLIWVGTTHGVARFDGSTFQLFEPEDSFSTPNVVQILEDSSSNIWAFCFQPEKELYRVSREKRSSIPYGELFKETDGHLMADIREVFGTPDIPLTTQTSSGEIYQLSENGFSRVGKNLRKLENYQLMQVDSEGFWVWEKGNIRDQLLHFSPEGELEVSSSFSHMDELFWKGKSDQPRVDWWAGRKNSGDIIFSIQEGGDLSFLSCDPPRDINTLLVVNPVNGDLAFCGHKEFRIYDRYGNRSYFHIEQGKKIFPIPQDIRRGHWNRKGEIWVTSVYGMYCVRVLKTPFKRLLYKGISILPTEKLTSCRGIYQVPDGRLFVNNYNGGTIVDQGKNIPYGKEFQNQALHGILQGRDGKLWIGNIESIFSWDLENGKSKKIDLSKRTPLVDEVWSLWEDHNGVIWIGGEYLETYDPKTGVNLRAPLPEWLTEGEFQFLIYQILPWEEDQLMLATSKGMYYFNPRDSSTAKVELPGIDMQLDCRHIEKDSLGNMWVATAKGLLHIPAGKKPPELIHQFNNLSYPPIHAVYPDRRGHLWLPGDLGLIRYDPVGGTAYLLGPKEGIPEMEFNRISHFRDEEGNFYFGGTNGVVQFHPDSVRLELSEPDHFVLTGLRQLNDEGRGNKKLARPEQKEGRILIPNPQTYVQVEFAFTRLFDGEKIQFQIRTEFSDEVVVEELKQNKFTFRPLGIGTHKIEVRAILPNGEVAKDVLCLTVVVESGLGKELWFVISGLVLLGLVFFFSRRRPKGKDRNSKEKALARADLESVKARPKNENKPEGGEPPVVLLPNSPDSFSQDMEWLREVREVADRLSESPQFSIADWAHELGLSERHLNRKLKQISNQTPNQFIRELRLEKAMLFLQEREYRSVKEVCHDVGFSTPGYFSKLFREKYGKSPSEFL